MEKPLRSLGCASTLIAFLVAHSPCAVAQPPVPRALSLTVKPMAGSAVDNDTYHGDALRSGWNAQETALTPATVRSHQFGHTFSVPLDATTFTQPLVAAAEQTASGTRDLVIVGTMRDTVYAFDGRSGALVWKTSLLSAGATPVPESYTACAIAPTYGILSTPAIDRSADRLFVVGVVLAGSPKRMHYYLHALSLATGNDRQPPVEIVGFAQEPNGKQTFIADVQTQRPAITYANGKVYVAFGGTCDYNASLYHGWIFAYNKNTLVRAGTYDVSPTPDYSSSGFTYYGGIWMSGAGLAVDPLDGSLLFAVGNGTFDGKVSFGDSAVRVSATLHSTLDFFTPSTVFSDNARDADFGSGGVMLLPDSSRSALHLAVAQGKDGLLTLMNRERLGGYTPGGPDNVLAEEDLGGVWSAPAYWTDGSSEYILTTGGPLYKVRVTRRPPGMSIVARTNETFPQNNGNGSTPTVSSNGTQASSAIVWIVQEAQGPPDHVSLYAYALSDLSAPIFHTLLGPWDLANAYLVPTVANGTVYVAGERQLHAFGLR